MSEHSKSVSIINSLHHGINTIAALSFTLEHPTIINVPHSVLNAYKTVLALGLELNTYSWTGLQHTKDILPLPIPHINDMIDVLTSHHYTPIHIFKEWWIGQVEAVIKMSESDKYRILIRRKSRGGRAKYNQLYEKVYILNKYNDWMAKLHTHTEIHLHSDCASRNRFRTCNNCNTCKCCEQCNMLDDLCAKCVNLKEYNDIYEMISDCANCFYDGIIACICQYSVGIVVECCNKTCQNEIVYNNKFECMGIILPKEQKNKSTSVAYNCYIVENIDDINNTLYSVRQMYAYNVRIFCTYCVDSKLQTCMSNGCYQYDSHFLCVTHSNTFQYNSIYNSIFQALSTYNYSYLIIKVITDYAIGILIECVNTQCVNEIAFYDTPHATNGIIEDIDGNDINCYSVDASSYDKRLKAIRLAFWRLVRIFCVECTKSLTRCCSDECLNYDCETICMDHDYCSKCNNYKFEKCYKCSWRNKQYCVKCSLVSYSRYSFDWEQHYYCAKCLEAEERYQFYLQIIYYFPRKIKYTDGQTVAHCISDYCYGVLVSCSNEICDDEIVFGNELRFQNNIDIDGNIIYKYVIDKKEIECSAVNIYGKRYRIFCSDCTKYNVQTCIDADCNVEDCRYYCSSNLFCMVCNKHKNKLRKEVCGLCKKTICNECRIDDECKECIIKKEQGIIFTAIKQSNIAIKNHYIIKLITQFSNGYIINCCNEQCKNIIIIDSIFELMKSNIKHYRVNEKYINQNKKNQFIHIYGQYFRVFCEKCISIECYQYRCYSCSNQDTNLRSASKYCFNHPQCFICCNYFVTDDQRNYICKNCKNYYCSYCGVKRSKLCKHCEIFKQLNNIKRTMNGIIGYMIGMDIISIISSYSSGYFLKCCNVKCMNIVSINDGSEFENNRDIHGNQICQYTISKIHMTQTDRRIVHFVFGQHRRYFCSKCVSLTRECKCYGCSNKVLYANKDGYCMNHLRCDQCGLVTRYGYDFLDCCHICCKKVCYECFHDIQDSKIKRLCRYLHIDGNYIFNNNKELIDLAIGYNTSKIERRYMKDHKYYVRFSLRSKDKSVDKKQRWKAKKKSKIKSYAKRRNDRTGNYKSNAKFKQKYQLSLQY